MQAAAMKPLYVFTQEVPADVLDAEREVQRNIAINEGKPADIAEKMVEGRIKKYYKEICLAEQPFIKNPDVTVGQLIEGKLTVKAFTRYMLGEGLEKRQDDFAKEVAEQMK